MHQIGTPVRLLKDFLVEGRTVMVAGQTVTISGHRMEGPHGLLYSVSDGNYHFLARQDDFSLVPSRTESKSLEEQVRAAFREGYSRGHSRGLTMGRLYKEDVEYRTVVQLETNCFMEERAEEKRLDDHFSCF